MYEIWKKSVTYYLVSINANWQVVAAIWAAILVSVQRTNPNSKSG